MAGDSNMTSRNKVFRGLGVHVERGTPRAMAKDMPLGTAVCVWMAARCVSCEVRERGDPERWRGEAHFGSRGYVVSWLRVEGHKILDSNRPLHLALISVR